MDVAVFLQIFRLNFAYQITPAVQLDRKGSSYYPCLNNGKKLNKILNDAISVRNISTKNSRGHGGPNVDVYECSRFNDDVASNIIMITSTFLSSGHEVSFTLC